MIDCEDDDELLLSAFETERTSRHGRAGEFTRMKDEPEGYKALHGSTSRETSYMERRRESPDHLRSRPRGTTNNSNSTRGGDSRSRNSRRNSRSTSRSPSYDRSRTSSYHRRGRSRSRSPARGRTTFRRSRSRSRGRQSPRPSPRNSRGYRSGSAERRDQRTESPNHNQFGGNGGPSAPALSKPKYVAAGSEASFVVQQQKTSTKKRVMPEGVRQMLREQKETKLRQQQAAARGLQKYDPEEMDDMEDDEESLAIADSVWKIRKVMNTRDMDCFGDDVSSSRIARPLSPPRPADTKGISTPMRHRGDSGNQKPLVGGAAFFSNVAASASRWGPDKVESRQNAPERATPPEGSSWGTPFRSNQSSRRAMASPAEVPEREEEETPFSGFVIPGLGDMEDEDKFLYGDTEEEDPAPELQPPKVVSPPPRGWPRRASAAPGESSPAVYLKPNEQEAMGGQKMESYLRNFGFEVNRSKAAPASADAAKREAELSRQVAQSIKDLAAKAAADHASKTSIKPTFAAPQAIASPRMSAASPRATTGISPIQQQPTPAMMASTQESFHVLPTPVPAVPVPPVQSIPYQAYPVPPPNVAFQNYPQQPLPQQPPPQQPPTSYFAADMGNQQQHMMNQQHIMNPPPLINHPSMMTQPLMMNQPTLNQFQPMNRQPGLIQRPPLMPLMSSNTMFPRIASQVQQHRPMFPQMAAAQNSWNQASAAAAINRAAQASATAAAINRVAQAQVPVTPMGSRQNLTVIQCNTGSAAVPITTLAAASKSPLTSKTFTAPTTMLTTSTAATAKVTAPPPKPHLPNVSSIVAVPKSPIERQALQEQYTSCDTKLGILVKELERLRKNQGDLMRKKQRQKDGHKDPQLLANGKLQEDISRQVASVKRQMLGIEHALMATAAVDDKSAEKTSKSVTAAATTSKSSNSAKTSSSSKPSDSRNRNRVPSRSPSPPPTHCSSASKKQPPPPKKNASVAPTTSSAPSATAAPAKTPKPSETPSPAATVVPTKIYRFIDQGNHWCKHCGGIFTQGPDLLNHLHAKHRDIMEKVVPADRPWAVRPADIKPTKAGEMTLLPFRGIEFVLPCQAFFCTLCKEFNGDVIAARNHLESDKHNFNYSKFCKANPSYARRTMTRRNQGLAKLAETSRKRKTPDKGSAEGGGRSDNDGRAKRPHTESQLAESKSSPDQVADAAETTKSLEGGKSGVKMNIPKKTGTTLDNDTDAKQKAFRESDMEASDDESSVTISKPGAKIPMKILTKSVVKGAEIAAKTAQEQQRAQRILSNVRKKKMQERAAEREQETHAAAAVAAARATPPPLEDFVCITTSQGPVFGVIGTTTTVPVLNDPEPVKQNEKVTEQDEDSGDDIVMIEMIDVSTKSQPPLSEAAAAAAAAATVAQEPPPPGTVDEEPLPPAAESKEPLPPPAVESKEPAPPAAEVKEPPPPGTEPSLVLQAAKPSPVASGDLRDQPESKSGADSLDKVLDAIPLPLELADFLDEIEEVPVVVGKSGTEETAEVSTDKSAGDRPDSSVVGPSAPGQSRAPVVSQSVSSERSLDGDSSTAAGDGTVDTGKGDSPRSGPVESTNDASAPAECGLASDSENATAETSQVAMETEPAGGGNSTAITDQASSVVEGVGDEQTIMSNEESNCLNDAEAGDEKKKSEAAEKIRVTSSSPVDSIPDDDSMVVLDTADMSDASETAADDSVPVTSASKANEDVNGQEQAPAVVEEASSEAAPNASEVSTTGAEAPIEEGAASASKVDEGPLSHLKVATPPPMKPSTSRHQKARCSRGRGRGLSSCSASRDFPKMIPCAVVIEKESIDLLAIQAASAVLAESDEAPADGGNEEAVIPKVEEESANNAALDQSDGEDFAEDDGAVDIDFGEMKVLDEAENSD